jgi:ubiquinone/menaquinone biosynthesis C-methylase UbiE
MKECSKSIQRRLSDSNFIRKYFVGNGIDIGGKPDPLSLYKEFFPLIKDITIWDKEDGDAQFLHSIKDNFFDFVHSSHCLEHINNPYECVKNWIRVTKKGGYLIITVPDEDLYEQGVFPSSFNKDHKWTFTIYKKNSWSSKSVNLIELIKGYIDDVDIIKIEQINSNYRYNLPRYDQTLTPVGESSIELIIRKKESSNKISRFNFSRLKKNIISKTIKLHLNQYKNDLDSLKKNNKIRKPFKDDSEIT